MARLIERVFDQTRPLIVRRFFQGAGRHWNPGDPFPWRQMSISPRRARLLFDAGKLTHSDSTAVFDPPPAMTPAPTIAMEMQDEDTHHAAVTAASDDDGLDALKMQELRAIAEAEGALTRVRRSEQIDAIRANRRANAGE